MLIPKMDIQLFAEGSPYGGTVEIISPEEVSAAMDGDTTPPPEPEVEPEPEGFPVEPEPDDETDDEAEPDDEPEPEFDTVTYNKEERKIPVSERQTYLQKGLNYDKIKERADEADSFIDRAAKAVGLSRQEYVETIAKAEKESAINNYAEKYDVNPETAETLLKQQQEIDDMKQQSQERDRVGIIAQQKASLRDNKIYQILESDIDDMLERMPNVDVDTAFKYLKGERFDELMATAKSTATKSAVADIQDKDRLGTKRGGARNSVPTHTSEVLELAKDMGLAVKDIPK